jgi:cytochrome c biogenesis protein CcmG/thiol:disulfide interchange protein DsbE|tara:strand:- start:8401 stop:8919 length:519 start_codon:yes stop_codon:yes gene_type:complete
MKKSYLILTSIFFIFIFTIFYLSLGKNKTYNTEDIVGNKIDEIDLELFNDSGLFNTKEITNYNYIALNFWASWCAPCRKEHNVLMQLSKIKNLKIIGVNFKDNHNNANSFLEEMGNPFYISTKDTDGKKSINFGVYGIPETMIISKDMVILKKYIGPLDLKDFKEIERIVKK